MLGLPALAYIQCCLHRFIFGMIGLLLNASLLQMLCICSPRILIMAARIIRLFGRMTLSSILEIIFISIGLKGFFIILLVLYDYAIFYAILVLANHRINPFINATIVSVNKNL